MTAKGWGDVGSGGIEQKGKRTHGHGQSMVIAGRGREYKGTKW